METHLNKLPEDFKSRWLAALRSGEYKQGEGSLCRIGEDKEKRYCCIGVGYRVATGVDPFDTMSGYIDGGFRREAEGLGVPKQILGTGSDNDIVKHLARMNDGNAPKTPKQSFLEIADYIEANL